MSKPKNLKELFAERHIGRAEILKIARDMFDGKTTAAGPEGYVITACNFDDLPDHVQGFVEKAILEFTVKNVFDVDEEELAQADDAVDGLEPEGDDDGLEKEDQW